uniref:Uncharacterized protein n=1 Tax=Triticum urartu TaxID=4572 RepID=A0A8R7UG76_TRIUA
RPPCSLRRNIPPIPRPSASCRRSLCSPPDGVLPPRPSHRRPSAARKRFFPASREAPRPRQSMVLGLFCLYLIRGLQNSSSRLGVV